MKDFIGTDLKEGDFFLHTSSGGIAVLRFGIVKHVDEHVILSRVYVQSNEPRSFTADNFAIYENDAARHVCTGLARVPESFVPLSVVNELRNPTNTM